MKLIRYERPEIASPSLNRLSDWFRDWDRSISFRNWPSLFDWEGASDATFGGRRLGADLYEDKEAYYARFELPGVKKGEVKIELHNAVLTVSFGNHQENEGGEQSVEHYSRSISVPDGVNAGGISAKHEDGLLTVTMPKAEAKKPRTIDVL